MDEHAQALTQSNEDSLVLCEALFTIASTSEEASSVRQAVGALQRTQTGLLFLQMHPLVD